jgi:hypothetical protein
LVLGDSESLGNIGPSEGARPLGLKRDLLVPGELMFVKDRANFLLIGDAAGIVHLSAWTTRPSWAESAGSATLGSASEPSWSAWRGSAGATGSALTAWSTAAGSAATRSTATGSAAGRRAKAAGATLGSATLRAAAHRELRLDLFDLVRGQMELFLHFGKVEDHGAAHRPAHALGATGESAPALWAAWAAQLADTVRWRGRRLLGDCRHHKRECRGEREGF